MKTNRAPPAACPLVAATSTTAGQHGRPNTAASRLLTSLARYIKTDTGMHVRVEDEAFLAGQCHAAA